jgi:hypothetical protein
MENCTKDCASYKTGELCWGCEHQFARRKNVLIYNMNEYTWTRFRSACVAQQITVAEKLRQMIEKELKREEK